MEGVERVGIFWEILGERVGEYPFLGRKEKKKMV
jgi:hypothetical protein